MADADCRCDQDGDDYACIDGKVYGPCSDERCGGVCEYVSRCECTCHSDAAEDANRAKRAAHLRKLKAGETADD